MAKSRGITGGGAEIWEILRNAFADFWRHFVRFADSAKYAILRCF